MLLEEESATEQSVAALPQRRRDAEESQNKKLHLQPFRGEALCRQARKEADSWETYEEKGTDRTIAVLMLLEEELATEQSVAA